MRPTKQNLKQHAAKPLTCWLIDAARNRSFVTYGQAKRRLETEGDFTTIFSAHMGIPAGELMYRIQSVMPDAPLLNVLLVQQGDKMPSEGAGPFMAEYLDDPRLANSEFRAEDPQAWRAACDQIASDVYAFEAWDGVYEQTFGEPFPPPSPPQGSERDGIRHARRGEGPRHRALRLWVRDHPGAIRPFYAGFRTATEVVLESADRVDVVYYGPSLTVAIEVKSSDSDESDLRRGIFQCIKYRAVMQAMDIRSDAPITAILVTQTPLPGDLKALAQLHGIRHIKARAL